MRCIGLAVFAVWAALMVGLCDAASADPLPSPTPAPYDRPPSGITPTTVSLSDVMKLLLNGEGTPSHPFTTTRETDAMSAEGETGSETDIESGDDYAATIRLGPMTTSSGRFKGKRWRQDENGYTRLLSGTHQEEELSSRAMHAAMLGRDASGVTLLGVVSSPVDAYVVEVHPTGGRHEWLFIDRGTGRLVRREASRIDRRLVWTYDDFRSTDGVWEPWHTHYSDGFPTNDIDWKTVSITHDVPVTQSELAIPPSKSKVIFPPGVTSVRLPARIERGVIIVRLTIAGRGLDFQLDSGASGILIDAAVVRQLGLQTFGESTQVVAGQFERSNAVVPELRIGDLVMRDVVVSSVPFNFDADATTKVVGLLGYDFLAGVVAKIDYWQGTVDAYDPATFDTPAGNVLELAMSLDDGVPAVGARVGNSVGDHFIVDTGAQSVIIFSAFADAHAADLTPMHYSIGGKTYYPMVTAKGVGGTLTLQPAIVSAFHFGGVGFQNFLLFHMTGAQQAFQGEDSDGLIGYQLLQYFEVYLDYRDSLLMLQPTARADGAATQ